VKETPEITRAFNEGCEARLRGVPNGANPHHGKAEVRLAWHSGWMHVQVWWGCEARGRAKPLPAVAVDRKWVCRSFLFHGGLS
jgi:hypothetical protein